MLIRKPMPRALAPHEPLKLQDHPRPRTRREFIAQGFMSGTVTAFIPWITGLMLANPRAANALSADLEALKTACKISNGSGIPFICFDLSGGANIAGSNVLVGQAGGQMDFLSTAGYAKLGLPGNMVPNASVTGNFTDTSMGLAFHSDSAFLRGINTRLSAAAKANINGCVIPARSQNDTNTSPHNPLYHIAKCGTKGSLLTLAGTVNSPSGGSSVALTSMMDPSIAPTKVSSISDIVGLAPGGSGGSIFTGPTAQADQVATMEAMARVAKFKLDNIDTGLGAGDAAAKELMRCNYIKNANTAELFNGPDSLNPSKDTNITGIFTAQELANNEFQKAAAIMKLIVNGFGGAACIQMGGFDYHTGDRATGERRDVNAGICIGACLEYAHRVGQPLMIYVFSDGSLSATNMIDNSVDGRGKFGWQGDNQATACSFFLVYNPSGRPVLRAADRQQLGSFTAGGDVSTTSSPAANQVTALVDLCVLNYLALAGREAEVTSLFPASAFASPAAIDKYSAFARII